MGTVHEDIYDILLNLSWNEKCFRKKVAEKIRAQIFCSITLFSATILFMG